jgi:predicted metal-binding protein
MRNTGREAKMPMDDIVDSLIDEEIRFAQIYDLVKTPLLCHDMVRQYCAANSCGKYGVNWTCPPAVGGTEFCINEVKKYSKVLVFRTEYKIGAWYDYTLAEKSEAMHQECVRRVRDKIPKDAGEHLVLSGGGCLYCKECAYVTNEKCRHPEKAIPSIESYCIDIFRFTKKNNIKYGAPDGEMYYFGMVLFN